MEWNSNRFRDAGIDFPIVSLGGPALQQFTVYQGLHSDLTERVEQRGSTAV